MINLNKFVAFVLCFLCVQIAWAAGEAVIFDRSELIAFDAGNLVSGYYNAQDDRKSCIFIFTQADPEIKEGADSPYSETKIFTFVPKEDNFTYQDRDKMFDISGRCTEETERGSFALTKDKQGVKMHWVRLQLIRGAKSEVRYLPYKSGFPRLGFV